MDEGIDRHAGEHFSLMTSEQPIVQVSGDEPVILPAPEQSPAEAGQKLDPEQDTDRDTDLEPEGAGR
ncbi:hypothetical protein [Glutamicibacter halophytocola]|uniref:hypothetical protein n=1 Tax=Glutamicibacter halophytocola TaxID=1933880 RepID=UPI003D2742D2